MSTLSKKGKNNEFNNNGETISNSPVHFAADVNYIVQQHWHHVLLIQE